MNRFVDDTRFQFQTLHSRPELRENMDDVRRQLSYQLALVAIGVAQAMILFYDPPTPFPWNMLCTWATLTSMGVLVLRLGSDRPQVARLLLAFGLPLLLVSGMGLFPMAWLPFVGVVLVFVAGILATGADVVAALLIGISAVILNQIGLRSYELTGVVISLSLALIVSLLIGRTLYVTLDLVWHMNQRAEELLETTRSQQAELRSAVKSLRIVNDIRERTGRELLVAQKHLREAQRAKEQFAANISHELRTPLSIILGFSEVMYLSPEVYGSAEMPPKLLRDIYQIYRNSRHLLEMIDDILDLSRFEMVGFTLHKEPTRFEDLVNEMRPAVADLFPAEADVALVVDLPDDLPVVDIDRIRIRQVLLNLLNNASRYTDSGEVRLSAEADDEQLIVHIRDTGIGIAPDALDAIFNEFYQVDHSLSRQYGGAGLGLSISKRFIDAHNGRIWVESKPGEGSTFSFMLPVVAQAVGLPDWEPSRPLSPPATDERPYVVLVEPDTQVHSMVQRHLGEYTVLPLQHPDGLDELVAQFRPLALLWNVQPGQTVPPDVAARVSLPLLECSLPSQARLADSLGARACLTKPIVFSQLQHELEKLGRVRHILLIDDNPGVCQLIERRLTAEMPDLNVHMAFNGETGLQAMRHQRPDVIILDLMMPELDGFGLMEAVRADASLADMPIILLTATSYFEDRLAQFGNQMRILHTQPWHTGETLRCLEGILDSLTPPPIDTDFSAEMLAAESHLSTLNESNPL